MSYNPYASYGGNPYAPEGDFRQHDAQDSNTGVTSNPYESASNTEQGYGQQSTQAASEAGHGRAQYNPYGGQGQTQQRAYGVSDGTASDSYRAQTSPYGQQQQDTAQPGHAAAPTAAPTAAAPASTTATAPQAGTSYAPTGQPIHADRAPLSQSDFLSRVEAIKADILDLTKQVSAIATAHQRALSSADSGASSGLEALLTSSQVTNTRIKDQIRFLEEDAVRSRAAPGTMKTTQVGSLKASFKKQLEAFRTEEADYERRYREQIARQYRIVHPEASEAEVNEATQADWGDEGVFQTALKTNRTATASTVLSAVRARHADIQRIEHTLAELNLLFEQLAEQVVLQEPLVEQVDQNANNVIEDTRNANVQLEKGVEHARRARRLKWICLGIVVLIIIALALGLGIGLTVAKKAS